MRREINEKKEFNKFKDNKMLDNKTWFANEKQVGYGANTTKKTQTDYLAFTADETDGDRNVPSMKKNGKGAEFGSLKGGAPKYKKK